MCMCEKPTINGENGYSWDGKICGIRPVDPPFLADGDEVVFDEPGRCGGLDSHSYHLRLVRNRNFGYHLLVRHGAGDERISLGSLMLANVTVRMLATLDTNSRYWMMLHLYHIHRDATRVASDKCDARWQQAAADKRIKISRNKHRVIVRIEEPK